MKVELMLALRNVRRHLRRSVLSGVAVIAGVFVLVVGQAAIGGLSENFVRATIDSMTAHVLIRPQNYPTVGLSHPVDDLMEVTDAAQRFLDDTGAVYTERLMFVAQATARGEAMRVRGIGYDPIKEPTVFPRDAWRIDGMMPAVSEDGVAVSVGVARRLSLSLGDEVVLQVRTPDGALNALRLPVSAVISAANPVFDKYAIFVTRSLADQLLAVEGRPSHIALRMTRRDPLAASVLARTLHELHFLNYDVLTWEDELVDAMALQRVRQRALDVLVLALLGISATGIANTILMAAFERVRELGTLRAMGLTDAGVLRLFLIEGGVIGAVGAAIGAAAGALVVLRVAAKGWDLTEVMEQGAGGHMPLGNVIYFPFRVDWILAAWAIGWLIAVLASVYPAYVATRVAPADAVRAP